MVTPPTGGDLICGFLARAGGAGKGWWPYWLTSTGASAARSYWENTQAAAHAAASGQGRPEIKLPVGFTTFPGEIFRAPRSWAEKSYPSLSYFHEADKGGHFAAWEEPELFATEIRAAFRPLR